MFLEFLTGALKFIFQCFFGGFLLYVILVTVLVHWYDLASRMPKFFWKFDDQLHAMWLGARKVKTQRLTKSELVHDLAIMGAILWVGSFLGMMVLSIATCLVYVEGYVYFKYLSPSKKLTPVYRINDSK